MRYWFWTVVGLAVTGASLVAAAWGIYHLSRIGTCASGGPYVSAHECPAGTGGYISAITLGVFVGLGGMFLYALRGDEIRPGISLGPLLFFLVFGLLAGAALYSAFGPAAPKDNNGGGIIMAVIFVPLAIGGLVALLRSGTGSREAPPTPGTRVFAVPAPSPAPFSPSSFTPTIITRSGAAPGAPASRGDSLDRLETLADLHAKGVLTDAEFAAQKKRILDEG